MTLLINSHNVSKSFGAKQLFSHLTFGIFQGDKIGLIGPNGAGKSTLLKILCGKEHPDAGTISCKKSLRAGYVAQASEFSEDTLENLVLKEMEGEKIPAYEKQIKVNILLSKLGFKDPLQSSSSLSGGWKKRLDLARVLANSPDLIFLDEPTNHLDLEGILWLESFLKNEHITFIVTSHDRYFLDHVATKMIELNPIYPQGLLTADGNYTEFVKKREAFFQNQQQYERTLSSKVRGEVDWLRQSPKARTTKSSARVQSAGKLIDELAEVRARNKQSKASFDFEATDRQTRKLLAAKNLAKSLGGRQLFSGIDLTLTQGIRLGIVGKNGTGKTTLLKLLAGEIAPDIGTIKLADGVRVVYFDQHRIKLNPNDTLRQSLSPNNDTVVYRGQHIHVNSWGKRFLFYPDRMDLPVRQLSGGEKARIGIARLMLQPADILLLDEPTNDLDIPTLETLEESLKEFPGAIVLITHDRALMDRLATCVIGLGLSTGSPLLADYGQWEKMLGQSAAPDQEQGKKAESKKTSAPLKTSQQKLSYHEKRELESMETSISAIEQEIEKLTQSMNELSEKNQVSDLQKACEMLDHKQRELEKLFHRWQELESKQK